MSKHIEEYIEMMVTETIEKANKLFSPLGGPDKIEEIPCKFDLTGSAAGMFCSHSTGSYYFRFNIPIAEINQNVFDQTIIHECAHYVARCIYGKVQAHGTHWKNIMVRLGGQAKRCHSYTMPEPTRKAMKRFTYTCGCRDHELTVIRHNRSQKSISEGMGNHYKCSKCKNGLFLKK